MPSLGQAIAALFAENGNERLSAKLLKPDEEVFI